MKTLLFWFFCLGFIPATALAEDAPAQCLYDFQCDSGNVCKAGRCVSPVFIPQSSADDLCGADRRCRIERLKRTNAARRHLKVLDEEETTRHVVKEAQRETEGPQPRLDSPAIIDARFSRTSQLGFALGYGLTPQIGVETQFFTIDDYVYYNTSYDLELMVLGASGVFYTNRGQIAGYASLGFDYVFGSADADDWDSYASNDTVMHAIELQAGVDIHSNLGFHTRLGVAYRGLIYHRVTSSPGVNDTAAEKDVERWFTSKAMIDIVFLIGWAF